MVFEQVQGWKCPPAEGIPAFWARVARCSVSGFASGTIQRLWLRSWHDRFGSSLAGLLLCCRYMMVAGKKALGDSGLQWEGPELKDLNRQRCGILIGAPWRRDCLLAALKGLKIERPADMAAGTSTLRARCTPHAHPSQDAPLHPPRNLFTPPFPSSVPAGTAMGGMATFATAVESLCTSYKKMNPFCIPFAIQNMGEPRGARAAPALAF